MESEGDISECEIKTFRLDRDNKLPINGDIYYPASRESLPVITIMHGFKAHRKWGFYPYVCRRLALAGAIVVCFDFSHNGVDNTPLDSHSSGKLVNEQQLTINEQLATNIEHRENTPLNPLSRGEFENEHRTSNIEHREMDIESFATNTVSKELEDAQSIIDFAQSEKLSEYLGEKLRWNGETYLLGHSLGGAISILASTKNNVNKLATWASISTFERFTKRQIREWHKLGYWDFPDNRTGQILRMNYSYYEDILENREKYSIPAAAGKLKIPFLILHGTEDMTVPLKEGKEIESAADKDIIRFEVIKKTGHTFGIEHPMDETTDALEQILNKTINFFDLK